MSVPALRFKEFTDVWIETSLGRVSNDVMYGMNAAAIPYDGVNKYIRITDIDEETREFIPSPLSSPDGEIQDKFKLKKGDLVFARTGASVGKSYLYKEKDGNLLFAGFLVKFSVVNADPYFIYAKTLTESYKGWLAIMSMRSGQPGVNAEELKEFKFSAPRIIEQTKIANFLTAVDEKITQLTQKHDLLTQYKKGVMQQIFSQELRFKDDDGRDFPEWKDKTLDEVALSISNGLNLDQSIERTGYMVTRIETISDRKINLEKVGYVQTEQDISNYKLDVGDILFSNINSISHIGKVVFVDEDYQLYHGMNLLRIVINQITNNAKFVFYQLSSERMKQNFETKANKAVNQASINQTELKKTQLKIPSKPEQTKIANFLTAIDDKITAIQAQLDAVKQYKQGLLQQMFV